MREREREREKEREGENFLQFYYSFDIIVMSQTFMRGGCCFLMAFVGLAYQGKDIIVFRFIIEYSSLRDFGPY